MDERKEPYIQQQSEEDALYTKLQRQTIDEAQRLAGNVWTDYNPHDPGITLSEAANHALAELDYKLGFGVTDLLSEKGRPFDGARFGLFPPLEVYVTSPVTENDYRKLLIGSVPGIENARVACDPATGGYAVTLTLTPLAKVEEEEVIRQVTEMLHARRNLCERLVKVEAAATEPLNFEADIVIAPGADATDVLARVYWRILRYLAGDITMEAPDSRMAEESTPEEWLDGSMDAARIVQPCLRNTEHELYGKLVKVEGVRYFRTCFLTRDGVPQTRFAEDSSLRIPKEQEDLKGITLRLGKQAVSVDIDRFLELLEGYYLTREQSIRQAIGAAGTGSWSRPSGTWRDVFGHYPIAADFPDCYRFTPEAEKPTAFEAYTRLYDRVIKGGLKELEALPSLLSISDEKRETRYTEDAVRLKSRYLDFLDAMYGVESHPAWLAEYNSYGETPAGTLNRRMRFLRNIARLERDRAKARDITLPAENGNTPAVKEWFCLLLGLDPDDGHTVSNVLPKHNLRLVETGQDCMAEEGRDDPDNGGSGHRFFNRIDSLLITERMLRAENVRNVPFMLLAGDEDAKREDYARMRDALPFFNENLITGDLFRGGTRLSNYKTVKVDEEGNHMLVYRHGESGGWTNLGQSHDREGLERLANILRRFLRELNKCSETLYIVEPVLADASRTFEVMLVLPSWTHRFHNARFRDKCRELLRSLVPAHLSGKVYWLREGEMRKFEVCYHQLMCAYADSDLAIDKAAMLGGIDEVTALAEETMDLDDTD